MFAAAAANSREIGWLLCRVTGERGRLTDLLLRLAGMGPKERLKPALTGKFLRLIDEVAEAHDMECSLLARIERIEHTHKTLRTAKKLKRFAPKAAASRLDSWQPVKPGSSGKFAFWAFVVLVAAGGGNQKMQGLTAD